MLGRFDGDQARDRKLDLAQGDCHGGSGDYPPRLRRKIMQTPVKIEFENLTPSPALQVAIDRHMAELEKVYGRATAGRFIVRGPGDHHKTGGQYQVSIRLALPEGREVNVGRTPTEDERYADLTFAVDDAFKRARRQLRDQASVMRGQ
jgi:ribosome-associated translation inhibitor RaiA